MLLARCFDRVCRGMALALYIAIETWKVSQLAEKKQWTQGAFYKNKGIVVVRAKGNNNNRERTVHRIW